ncbi:ATP-grasp domain-containing protein [Massilimicrobiota sp. An134]|uniref:ATP-binding protein n=1 Tax=Massilimicrobiota sp. An134 TaxID=1965557 RepID=UPI001F14F4D7|nr:ATP-grasp domain-containing protein [Massilimicrobiota sp. An134]
MQNINYQNNKNILILGGTLSTLDVVKTAKKMRLKVTITDNLEGGVSKQYADEIINYSTDDYTNISKYIKENHIDGVFTGASEFNIKNMINICNQNNLPVYCNMMQWDTCSNKSRFKQLCKEYGVNTVPEYFIDSHDCSHISDEYFPLIIKPVDSYSGHGISICRNRNELNAGIKKALDNSKSKQIILEKYMQCDNVEVYYIVQDGHVELMTLSDRITRNDLNGSPIPTFFYHPSKHKDVYLQTTNEKVCKMFEKFGLENGVFFMESFFDGKDFYFYEMGYRLNATMEYKFVEYFNGFSPLEYMIQYAIEGKFGNQKIKDVNKNFKGYACEIAPILKSGIIKNIIGLEDILKDKEVIHITQFYHIGDHIKTEGTLDQNFARIQIVSSTEEELHKKIDKIISQLHVIDENGNDLLLPLKGMEK